MKEERKIILNNQIVPYEIQYKNIKNCYLRIEQGKVKISTSRYYSLLEIENLIRKVEGVKFINMSKHGAEINGTTKK